MSVLRYDHKPLPRRYFDLETIRAMIPTLEQTAVRVLQLRAAIQATFDHLDSKGFAPVSDDFELSPQGAPVEICTMLGHLRALAETLNAELSQTESRGIRVRSLDPLTVEMYSHKEGTEVIYGWRFGEPGLRFEQDLRQNA